MQKTLRTTALLGVVVAFAGLTACASIDNATDKAADKTAEQADKLVISYRDKFCNPTGCAENRLACALPAGAMVRVLNADQIAQTRAFIDDTDGTCKR